MAGEKNFDAAVRAALRSQMRRLWRLSLSLTGAPDQADDLVQATCLRALEKAHTLSSTDRVEAWIMTVCRSIWYNELRARKVRKAQSLSNVTDDEIVALIPSAEENIFATEVFTEVMRLPEAQRAVVTLVLVEGLSYREAAEILDVPLGTVMSRLHGARAKLRKFAGLSKEATVG